LTPDAVVMIPLGAGASEHGPHLRLGTDLALAEHLARRVTDSAAVVTAPPLAYHFYPAFIEYPGSTTLNLDTARTLTVDLVRSLARYGPRRFYVLNTGVSTSRALAAAAETLAQDGILLAYTDYAARLEEASARVRQQEGGTHADEIETSAMLYVDPDGVEMKAAAKEFTPSAAPSRFTRTRGGTGTYSASGVWGDPTLATAEKGRVIVEALVAGVLRDIEATRRAPLPVASRAPSPPATTAAPRAAAGGEPRMPSDCTAGDERTIRQVGTFYGINWQNMDAEALAGMWSDKGDLVHPDGIVERGRETIRTNRAAMFLRREYRGSLHPLTVGVIRCVTADVAVADAKWELRNVTDTAGKLMSPFEGQATLVLKRAGGAWLIEAYRYTIKPTPVPPPTWLKRPGWPGAPGD
ncbi:MAG TPA: SgcJ/EcaC family oxidoreductase, partial [Vicinamibacterales bacterium]